jgi:hypothetical protein
VKRCLRFLEMILQIGSGGCLSVSVIAACLTLPHPVTDALVT